MLTLSSIERKVIENLKCVRCTGATYKHIAFVKHILYIICIKFRRKKSFVFTRELYLSIANDQCVSVKLQCITFHYCLALIFVLCAFFLGVFVAGYCSCWRLYRIFDIVFSAYISKHHLRGVLFCILCC